MVRSYRALTVFKNKVQKWLLDHNLTSSGGYKKILVLALHNWSSRSSL